MGRVEGNRSKMLDLLPTHEVHRNPRFQITACRPLGALSHRPRDLDQYLLPELLVNSWLPPQPQGRSREPNARRR